MSLFFPGKQYLNYIDGKWVSPSMSQFLETLDPATELPIATFARSTFEDVDHAVRAAHRAMEGEWSLLSATKRGQLMMKLADLVVADRDRLAQIETLDVGKPLRDSLGDIDGIASTLRYNAGAADKMEGCTIPQDKGVIDFTILEPLGVTAHIVPWNFPLGMVMRSLAPALAAGCTAVIKPAEQTPLSALAFAEQIEKAGFPPGVINIVTGYGEEAGDALVRHPLVRGITFTGSVETGRKIMAAAAQGIKPVVLELGGKNPMIVFADADLDRAVTDAAMASFENCGQVCSSASRYLLAREIRDEFIDRLCARISKLKIGPGIDNNDIGPLVSNEQYGRITNYISEASAAGARLRQGGQRPSHLRKGYFIEPTVFDHVTPEMVIAREEVFGPVSVAMDITTENDAIAIANGLGFGLAAGIYTRDIGRAMSLTRKLEHGSVWINGWWMGGVQAPTGGMKESGIGRERGLAGIRNYLQIKNIAIAP